MRRWYTAAMPGWRSVTYDWPLSRECSEDIGEDAWSVTRKGGGNGFAMLIVALSWWLGAAKSAPHKREAMSMVEDVVFVLGALTSAE